LDALADAVRRTGVEIRLGSFVTSIKEVSGGLQLTANGEQHLFDFVISSSSPRQLLSQAPAIGETPYGDAVRNLDSIGAVCVVLALDQSLLTDGTYWLNLPATGADKSGNQFPFLALVEHTNWMDKRRYGGDTLVYCGDYADPNHEYFSMTDDALVERFTAALPLVNPAFDRKWIRKSWVWRAQYAQPVPGLEHSRAIPDLKTPITGLFWASMSQVYPWDRGTNYAIEIGRRVAKRVLDEA